MITVESAARHFARSLPNESCDWEDLAQESRLHSLRGRKSITGPMVDLLRKSQIVGRRRVTQVRSFPISEFDSVECSHERTSNGRIDASRFLRRASPLSQEALKLKYLHEMSESEIAGRLGVSIDVVRARVHYGLQRIRNLSQLSKNP